MADLARSLQALLDAIHRDEMTASTAMVYRLEGAVTALQAVVVGVSSSLSGTGIQSDTPVERHRELP
jgi:hypothetical protein